MNFQDLRRRLILRLLGGLRNGEFTERSLARRSGISQPHIHNVLKGKRLFSWEAADAILRELGLDVSNLLEPEEFPYEENHPDR